MIFLPLAPASAGSSGSGGPPCPPPQVYSARLEFADSQATTYVTGSDFNRDGIPDAMERQVATTYATQAAPAYTMVAPMTSYAAPEYITQATDDLAEFESNVA